MEESSFLYKTEISPDELVQRYQSGERCFRNIDLADRSDLRNSVFAGATFEHCILSDIDFRDANLRDVAFLSCNVKCTDFRGADLEGSTFRGSAVESAYFENANLGGVSFAGAYFHSYELTDKDMPGRDGWF